MMATWILILTINAGSGKVAIESMEIPGHRSCLKAGQAWVDLQDLPKDYLNFICVR